MSAKVALQYLSDLNECIKRTLSENTRKYLDESGYDFFESIIKCKELIEDRLYMMEEDEIDYIKLTNMELVLKNHFTIFTMLESGAIKNDTLLEIDIFNE